MPEAIVVQTGDGDRLHVRIGRHGLVLDQPVSDGGTDTGPTPTSLFVAGLAACVAHYGSRYLRRHGLPTDGFGVRSTYRFADDSPPRVGAIDIQVLVPAGLSQHHRETLRRVTDRCTVGNSLRDVPPVVMSYRDAPAAEPAAVAGKGAVGDVLHDPARR